MGAIAMIESEIGKRVKDKILKPNKMTQRDLFLVMRENDVDMSESGLSNRIKGIVDWKEEEVNFLENYYNVQLKND